MKKQRIPKGYKEAFTSVYESKGKTCVGNASLCLKCKLFAVCGTNKPSEAGDMFSAVKPYFLSEEHS